jgi:hypothetical protein
MRRGLVLGLVAAGCGGHRAPAPALDVTPAAYSPGMLTVISDGDAIDLTKPPQGGFVVFVGALVSGLGNPLVNLRGRFVDPSSGELAGEDARTVELMPSPTDSTVWIPDLRGITGVANVPMCPSASADDHYGRPFQLEVQVTEIDSGRVGTVMRQVVPSCRQTGADLALCQCQCQGHYVLGKCTM